jgi:hypothetical protein
MDLPRIMSDEVDEHAVLLYNGRRENVLGLYDEVARHFSGALAKFAAMDCGLQKCERVLSRFNVHVPYQDVEPIIIFFHRPSEHHRKNKLACLACALVEYFTDSSFIL